MTFLPIVGRELRVAARRKSTYRSRFWAAFFAIGVLAFLLLVVGRGQTAEQQAQYCFGFLGGLAFVYCVLAGITSTSDCVSEEKREGTLGLLFLTDLKGYDVAAGKLVASSINTFYGLVAIIPVLAIPLLLGGISREQVWYTVIVLLNTLFFSLAAGLWISTLCKSDRTAMGNTVFVLMFFTAGLPLFGVLWKEYLFKGLREIPPMFYIPSPGYAFGQVVSSSSRAGGVGEYFWVSVLFTHAMSWIFVGLASLVLPRSWQDKPKGVRALKWNERWKLWSFGDGEQRRAFRARLLDVNAFYWLAGRNRLKPAHVWFFLGLVGVAWLWSYVKYPDEWLDAATYISTEQILHTALKVWIAMEACRRLGEDHHSGSLELILSTPITVADILRGQMQALYRQFLGPVTVVLALDFLFLLTKVRDSEWVLWHLGNTGMFVLDAYALAWVAMWTGLTARHVNRAPHTAILRILILPILAWIVMVMMIALLNIHVYREGQFFLGAYLVLGFVTSTFFLLRARLQLHDRLRTIASQRYDPHATRAADTKAAAPKPAPAATA